MSSVVVCLTGMHRSGTSLTASWLQRCGLTIDVGGLVGAAEGNPRGHYEDVEMMTLHREEFVARSRRSRGWQMSRPEFLSFSGPREQQARDMLRARDERFSQWGWKDPRSVAFLPSWRELEPGLVTMLLWRPAHEVVSSLVRRARSSRNPDMQVNARRAVQTWIAYNELALRYRALAPERTLLFRLGSVVDNDSKVFEQLRDRFGLQLTYEPLSAAYESTLLTAGSDAGGLRLPWGQALVRGALSVQQQLEESSDL